MFDTLISDVKGEIEKKVLNDGNVDVKGWSFSHTHSVCPTRFKYDGTIKSVAIDVRKDICEKFNKNNVILSGWHTSVPINKYIDIQMKLGSEWTSILSFNTFNMNPDVIKLIEVTEVTEQINNINISSSDASKSNVVDNIINNYNKQNPTKPLNQDNVKVIDFQTNILQTANLIVFDNFYTNPNSVHNYALLSLDDNTLNNSIKKITAGKQHFEKILNTKLINFNKYEHTGGFSTSIAGDKIVFDTKNHQFIALIFLQNDAPLNTGITLYRSKHTKKTIVEDSERDVVFKSSNLDSTDFEPVDIIGNVFNRLVIFNTKQIHAISNHFGSNINNSRLVQTFAFDAETSSSNSASTKISFNM